MCGIAGFWLKEKSQSSDWFDGCLSTLSRRGPDGKGKKELDDGKLLLGHTRLSIIDVSDRGRQPLHNEDKTVWITFNGEIYNYKPLRMRLIDSGHEFTTQTDTEVILHAFEEWGPDCVSRFNGIFAFAVWDQKTRQLFLARDHIGVKPLYYIQNASFFGFASQPKAIVQAPFVKKDISTEAFRDYLTFGYIPDPRCIFEGIQKLPPGHMLMVSRDGITARRYWKVEYRPSIRSFADASEAVGNAIHDAVNLQLTSDVPVGTLLSGGIDSTLITGIANNSRNQSFGPLRTFTLGFDEPANDERAFALVAATHYRTAHFQDALAGNDFLSQLQIANSAFDEPFDPNGPMPATRIAQLVRDHDTKVVLGGDGGDELFAGYLRYDAFAAYRASQNTASDFLRRILRPAFYHRRAVLEYFRNEGACDHTLLAEMMPDASDTDWARAATHSLEALYDRRLPAVTACQMMDLNHYLPGHILTKVDRATMHFGVEARVPLLDVKLVELAFSIDCSINYRDGERKAVLKQAASKILPPPLLTGRKKGFSSPMVAWFNDHLQQWAVHKIENGILVKRGVIYRSAASGLLSSASYQRLRVLWLLLAGEMWAEQWLEGRGNDVAPADDFALIRRSSC